MDPRTLVAVGVIGAAAGLLALTIVPTEKAPGAVARSFEGYSVLPPPTQEQLAPRDTLGAQVLSKEFGAGQHTWSHKMQDFIAGA